MKATLLWSDDDDRNLRMAGEVLARFGQWVRDVCSPMGGSELRIDCAEHEPRAA